MNGVGGVGGGAGGICSGTGSGTGGNDVSQYGGGHQTGSALSTAAMVAAAATATATATASVVAIQDNTAQFQMGQQNQQYNATSGYGQQRSHNPMSMNNMPMSNMNGMSPMNQMANMGMNMHNNMLPMNAMNSMGKMAPQNNGYPRRLTPYPTPAMHMSQKRGQQGYPNGPGPNMQPGFNPNGQYPYGNAAGRPGFQGQYPPQQPLGPSGNFGPGNMRNSGNKKQPIKQQFLLLLAKNKTNFFFHF